MTGAVEGPATGAAVTGRGSRRRTCLVRVLLMLGAPLALLLLVELVWQVIGDPRIAAYEEFLAGRPPHFRLAQLGMLRVDPDPELAYTLVPGFDAVVAGNRYRIDPNGFRGEPVAVAKRPGSRRILVLGDSYAFGFGVAEADMLGSRLRGALAPDHPDIEVITLAVPGYQTGQEARILERDGLRFAPDLVVLVYYANDNFPHPSLYDERHKLLYNDQLPLPYRVKLFMNRSILYAEITKRYTRILAPDARGPRNWPVTSSRLRAIAAMLRERKIGFVLVAIPALSNSTDFVDGEHVYTKDHERLLGFTKAAGIGTVDVRAILMRRAPRPIEDLFVSLDPPDSHLTGEGYGLIAEALRAHIEAEHLLR